MADYNISGLTPALTGGVTSFGDSWFLFDQSGTFSVDKDLNCTIYLVGGGCHGAKGTGSLRGTSNGGQGGNGGYVNVIQNVNIPKNKDCNVTIAPANNIVGTTLDIVGNKLACNDSGSFFTDGGKGAYAYDAGKAYVGL